MSVVSDEEKKRELEDFEKDPLSLKFFQELTLLLQAADNVNRGVEWYNHNSRALMRRFKEHGWLCPQDLISESEADLKKYLKDARDAKILLRLLCAIRDGSKPVPPTTAKQLSTGSKAPGQSVVAPTVPPEPVVVTDSESEIGTKDTKVTHASPKKIKLDTQEKNFNLDDLSVNFYPSEHSMSKCSKHCHLNQFPQFNIGEILKELEASNDSDSDPSEGDVIGEITKELAKRKADREKIPRNLNSLMIGIEDFLTALCAHKFFTFNQATNYRRVILRIALLYKSAKVAAYYDRNIRKTFCNVSKGSQSVNWSTLTSEINDHSLRAALASVEEENKTKKSKKVEQAKTSWKKKKNNNQQFQHHQQPSGGSGWYDYRWNQQPYYTEKNSYNSYKSTPWNPGSYSRGAPKAPAKAITDGQ